MSRFLTALSDASDRYIKPITRQVPFQTLYPVVVLCASVVGAIGLNNHLVQAIGKGVAVFAVLVMFVWFLLIRLTPVSLSRKWLFICMRHHSELFQRLMMVSFTVNWLFRADGRTEAYYYRKGTILDYIKEEQAEFARFFPGADAYVVTFDLEATERLKEGIEIGEETYRLWPLDQLNLDPDSFVPGMTLVDPYRSHLSADGVGKVKSVARPLFSGLSGVVVKRHKADARVGGFDITTDNKGILCFDLMQLVGQFEKVKPTCPVYILNWPVLLFNLATVCLTGTPSDLAHRATEEDIRNLVMRIYQLARSGKPFSLVDNPYVLMDRLGKDREEAIVIGGGTWLVSEQQDRIAAYPIRSFDNKAVFLRFVECMGYLLKSSAADVTDDLRRDIRKIDKWVANQVRARSVPREDASANIGVVGRPCWADPKKPLPQLPAFEVHDREMTEVIIGELPMSQLAEGRST